MDDRDKSKDELIQELEAIRRELALVKSMPSVDALADFSSPDLMNENLFKAIVQNSSELVILTDESGIVTYVSPQSEAVLGYPSSKFIGKLIPDIIHPDDVIRCHQAWIDVFEQRKQISDFEYRIIDHKDQTRWVSHSTKILEMDGKYKGIINTIRNISKRKRTEEEAHYQQHLMNALMDNVPFQIYFKDRQSRFILINNAQALTFGLNDPKMAVGQTDFDFFTHEHAQQAFEDEQHILRTGHIINKEEKETRENLPECWVSTVKLPLCDDSGKIIGTFGISTDITQRKRQAEELTRAKEHAEESDRLKTVFLQNMSHEIRTPMNAIMGFSELLLSSTYDKQRIERYAQIVVQSSTDLQKLLNDILDISQIESGQVVACFENCKLSSILHEITPTVHELQLRLQKEHIEFITSVDPNEPNLILSTDCVKLKQILIYLINNAFKFTDIGKIELGFRKRETEVLLFVADTGIGISLENQSIIFNRFAQLNNGASRVYKGTGLGLAIVRGLANIIGGKIWLESEPLKGSTFFISLPANTRIKNTPDILTTTPAPNAQFANKKMLVVDDDLSNVEFLKQILTQTGIVITHTESVREVFQLCTSQLFDIVLINIHLSGNESIKTIKLLRKNHPQLSIIGQTSRASAPQNEEAIAAGCNDLLVMPVQQQVLLATISNHLS